MNPIPRVPLHRCLTQAAIALSLAMPALAHDGEMLEPRDGATLFGIGNSKFDAEDFALQSGLVPRMQKMYIEFDALTTHPITSAKLLQILNQLDANGQIAQIGIDFKGWDPTSIYMMDKAITLGLHDAFLDRIADVMRDFGKPVFIVPGFEFNLVGYTPGVFPQAYRYIVDHFRDRGADHVAWVWNPFVGDTAPSEFDAQGAGGAMLWYPGRHYVRWLSANVFVATAWKQGSQDPKAIALNALMDFAEAERKPVMFSETTSLLGTSILPTSHPNAATQANTLWANHFFHMFDFIQRHERLKSLVYISTDWSLTTAWQAWGNARVQDNAYLLQKFLGKTAGDSFENAGVAASHPWVPHLIRKTAPGGALPFQIHNLSAGAPAALLVSTQLNAQGIPFAQGVDGEFLLASPVFYAATAVAGANGQATIAATLPANPSLSGLKFESQWVSLEGVPTPMRVEIQ